MKTTKNLLCAVILFYLLIQPNTELNQLFAQTGTMSKTEQTTRDIYKELVEINTTHSKGNTTEAAEAMAVRLKSAGFSAEDVYVSGPHPLKGNLVARLRGSGSRKPLLLIAHLDVVEADIKDWSVDPFKFIEKDGYFYGRGTSDDKAMAAIWIANLIRFKEEKFVPDRDIIIALTADEEGGNYNGIYWLLRNHRELIDAEYALNEGGSGVSRNGKRLFNNVQLSEKVYLSFKLEVTNPGGHSSIPKKDNAIYRLAEGLVRLSKFDFPVKLNDGTREYFRRMSEIETGQVAEDMKAVILTPPDKEAVARLSAVPQYNALLRTTCVATMLNAGHAENALPQRATAIVNSRMLPGESPDEVQRTIGRVLADDEIKITRLGMPLPSQPSPLNPDVMGAIERITDEMWQGVTVIPTMGTGATDGAKLRNAGIPTYGVSGLFADENDRRVHGRDERMGVQSFYEGQEFLYRLVKALSSDR